jgi:hypothetical protein
MPNDGKSSHCLWQGELKRTQIGTYISVHFFFWELLRLWEEHLNSHLLMVNNSININKWTSTSHLKQFNTKKTTQFEVGNPGLVSVWDNICDVIYKQTSMLSVPNEMEQHKIPRQFVMYLNSVCTKISIIILANFKIQGEHANHYTNIFYPLDHLFS